MAWQCKPIGQENKGDNTVTILLQVQVEPFVGLFYSSTKNVYMPSRLIKTSFLDCLLVPIKRKDTTTHHPKTTIGKRSSNGRAAPVFTELGLQYLNLRSISMQSYYWFWRMHILQ